MLLSTSYSQGETRVVKRSGLRVVGTIPDYAEEYKSVVTVVIKHILSHSQPGQDAQFKSSSKLATPIDLPTSAVADVLKGRHPLGSSLAHREACGYSPR